MDKKYWNSYYEANESPHYPTNFTEYLLKHLARDSTILDLGCGNGRDSLYFAEKGYRVLACDQSEVVIKRLQGKSHNPSFFVADIAHMNNDVSEAIDAVYARFVLHALNDVEAQLACEWVYMQLPPGGLFFSESRSLEDHEVDYGEQVTYNIFMTDHKRRLLDRQSLASKLEAIGFIIDDLVEGRGLAVHKTEDPLVIRLICRKP